MSFFGSSQLNAECNFQDNNNNKNFFNLLVLTENKSVFGVQIYKNINSFLHVTNLIHNPFYKRNFSFVKIGYIYKFFIHMMNLIIHINE